MRVVFGGRRCEALALLALCFAGMTACRNDAIAPKKGVPPLDQMTNFGTTIVDVNLKTGKIVTHPLESGAVTTSGVDARFFGGPGTISHTFTLRGGAPSVGNTYTLDDHIENVFTFAIGTHLPHVTGGVFPQDTMGVYVFMSRLPTVTFGCTPSATCSVAADSGYDGAYPFTSGAPQPYMFFKTILEAADATPHSGRDFTDQTSIGGIDYFRSFSFRAKAGVTDFKFGVAVSAAVEKPNDTRWKVSYIADSLPNRVGVSLADLRSEPDWRLRASSTAVTDTSIKTAGCTTGAARCFQIISHTPVSGATDSITYFRSDSLGTTDSAYIAADFVTANLTPASPSVFLGMRDGVRKMLLGFSSNKVGFCDASNAFLSGVAAPVSIGSSTAWRLSKFGADSVVVFNGTNRVIKLLYTDLPAASAASFPTAFFFFGNRAVFKLGANPAAATSRWTDFVYEIGATKP